MIRNPGGIKRSKHNADNAIAAAEAVLKEGEQHCKDTLIFVGRLILKIHN